MVWMCVWISCQQCSCHMFSACVCVYLRGGGGLLMFSSVVLSPLLQQETEIVRSQGTIGGKVTIAQASSSLIWVLGVTGSVLLPWCVLSCQRPQWNKLNPDTSLSEVPMYAHTGRRLVQYSFLLYTSFWYFLFWHFFLFSLLLVVPLHPWFLPLISDYYLSVFVCPNSALVILWTILCWTR